MASAASTARSSAPVPAAMSDASVASGGAEGVSYGHGLILGTVYLIAAIAAATTVFLRSDVTA